MSHHVSASATNPSGAVEVVRVASSATTQAPVDAGSATGAAGAGGGNAPIATGGAPAAGSSGTPGANLPVDEIQQASNTIQSARADLSRTTGAERRLDGFDGVGGGGGGGGAAGGEAAAGDTTVAAGTDQLDSEKLAGNTQQVGADGQQLTSTADSSAAASGGIEGNEQQGSSLAQLDNAAINPTGGTGTSNL